MNEQSLLSLFLPQGILNYFEVSSFKDTGTTIEICLAEKNEVPNEFLGQKLISKGYFDSITIRDFPIRDKACYLIVKRRKWLNENTGSIVFRDWDMVAKGTRMTQEFASFLKEIARYQTR